MIPTAAVLETAAGFACWVQTATGPERRSITLGDSSDMFLVVEDGVEEGEEVVPNPIAFIEEAQIEAAQALETAETDGAEIEF